jgi:uncharacterized protein (DUF2235 family)
VKDELDKRVAELETDHLLYRVKIQACVVWDTVSTLGLPTELPPRPLSFVGKRVPKAVNYAFQALALDETRAKFKPRVWESKEREGTVVKQCWFLGSHGDIGGSGDAALGAITLIWMVGQLYANTEATFDMSEITKHLKHKFLEWDYRVNKTFALVKENLMFSNIPSSGKYCQFWFSSFRSILHLGARLS